MKYKNIKIKPACAGRKYTTGFTLVESLVAISILSMSILSTYTAVQNSLQSSSIAKDRIVAFYLAQEGMEYIKNIRDENALHAIAGIPTNWLHGLSEVAGDPCYFGKVCKVDSQAKVASFCGNAFNTCPVLNQNSSSGLFGYASGGNWVVTNFKREIQFAQNSVNEIAVTISISWTTKGTTKSFQVKQLLFNRQ